MRWPGLAAPLSPHCPPFHTPDGLLSSGTRSLPAHPARRPRQRRRRGRRCARLTCTEFLWTRCLAAISPRLSALLSVPALAQGLHDGLPFSERAASGEARPCPCSMEASASADLLPPRISKAPQIHLPTPIPRAADRPPASHPNTAEHVRRPPPSTPGHARTAARSYQTRGACAARALGRRHTI
ncbi:uncharacterized protein B0H18DRAFT_328796 [Fomitopsis serialis]|uniref:uncharacterized protein n=1 Tax=Fomitopsis serialis TaxID=139415 RepID=UPI0020077647|nr:uncharacterized protein B0H18DRAFT_328796 [Neoantrodia serialis]KAH9936660.1 hypothetical protein B0H18DRAFT_328796 [Neoantrodia serialis]